MRGLACHRCLHHLCQSRRLPAPRHQALPINIDRSKSISGSLRRALISTCALPTHLEFVLAGMTLAQLSLPTVQLSQTIRSLLALMPSGKRPNAFLSKGCLSTSCRSAVDAACADANFAGLRMLKCLNMFRLKEFSSLSSVAEVPSFPLSIRLSAIPQKAMIITDVLHAQMRSLSASSPVSMSALTKPRTIAMCSHLCPWEILLKFPGP